MRLKEVHYPYPVLTPYSDDILGEKFIADVEFKVNNEVAQLDVLFSLKNSELLNLIENEKAVFVTQISCQSTLQRLLFKTKNQNDSFSIDSKLLNGRVYINFFVLANCNIKNYTNEDFHSDFEGEQFEVNKGERLAVAQTVQIEVEKEPVAKTSSIFQLVPNYKKDGLMFHVDLQDKIIIRISREEHKEIQHLIKYGESYNKILISLYYMPALIETLYRICEVFNDGDVEEIENTEWFKSISHRLMLLGYEIENLTSEYSLTNIALKILDNPNRKSLMLIESQWEED